MTINQLVTLLIILIVGMFPCHVQSKGLGSPILQAPLGLGVSTLTI